MMMITTWPDVKIHPHHMPGCSGSTVLLQSDRSSELLEKKNDNAAFLSKGPGGYGLAANHEVSGMTMIVPHGLHIAAANVLMYGASRYRCVSNRRNISHRAGILSVIPA
jgi:hypothetical protein